MHHTLKTVIAALSLAALSALGCAHVGYRADASSGDARVKEAVCTVAGDQVHVTLAAADAPVFALGRTELSGRAEAPYPTPARYEAPAEMTYDNQFHRETFAAVATWWRHDRSVCIAFRGSWKQGHLAESAPPGPDGRPQLVTEHPVELGPWCFAGCP